MITYIIIGYAKPGEIINYIHNRNFNRYMNQHMTVIILVYCLLLKSKYHANILLNNFDGAKENLALQILILP